MEIARGDLVIAVLPGDYGKGRPALVVQADAFNPTHAGVVVCPVTSHLVDAALFRLRIRPSPDNGLAVVSEIMIDKIMAHPAGPDWRFAPAEVIGRADRDTLRDCGLALRRWLATDESDD